VGVEALDSVTFGASNATAGNWRDPGRQLGVALRRVPSIRSIEACPELVVRAGTALRRSNPGRRLHSAYTGGGQGTREPVAGGKGGAVLEKRRHPDDHREPKVTSHHDVGGRSRWSAKLNRDYTTVVHARIMRT
jgi:hypothetical protein